MTERERLIELIINADTYDSYECLLCTKDDDACDCCHAEKLAEQGVIDKIFGTDHQTKKGGEEE